MQSVKYRIHTDIHAALVLHGTQNILKQVTNTIYLLPTKTFHLTTSYHKMHIIVGYVVCTVLNKKIVFGGGKKFLKKFLLMLKKLVYLVCEFLQFGDEL